MNTRMVKAHSAPIHLYLYLVVVAFLTSSCTLRDLELDMGSTLSASKEPGYYSSPTTYSDASSVVVSFKAEAKFRPILEYSGTYYLGPVSNEIRPIPYAEFHIYNSQGTRIQQGETDKNGNISAKIPKTIGTYSIKVFSRSFNSYLKVSVLKDLYNNQPHFIEQEFTLDTSNTSGSSIDFTSLDLIAEADDSISSEVEGAAFNIHYMIYITNEYIRKTIEKDTLVSGVPSTNTNQWFVADKVQVYWKRGFNPSSYFYGSSADGASFYIPSENKMFILGGMNGNISSADTDHFDNSVIIHEYGHFLENRYSNAKSKGGAHNGNGIIDARLAWSEGFANYFQSEVLNGSDLIKNSQNPTGLSSNSVYNSYIDTAGYSNTNTPSSGYAQIDFSLYESGKTATLDRTASDLVGYGNFREVSIARLLFKASRNSSTLLFIDGITSIYGGDADFKYIWQVFAGENKEGNNTINPYAYSLAVKGKYPLSNSGLFNYLLKELMTAKTIETTHLDTLLNNEKQADSTINFARYLSSSETCSETTIGPSSGENVSQGYISHPLANNDFYIIQYTGGNGVLRLNYTANTSTNPMNLDLIVHKIDYDYVEDKDLASGDSSTTIVRQSRTTNTTETVNLSGLSTGYYFVVVKVNAYEKTANDMSGKTANYKLSLNGVDLCGIER